MPIFSVPEPSESEKCESYSNKLYLAKRVLAQVVEDMARMRNTSWSSKLSETEVESVQVIATVGPEVVMALHRLCIAFLRESWDRDDQNKGVS